MTPFAWQVLTIALCGLAQILRFWKLTENAKYSARRILARSE